MEPLRWSNGIFVTFRQLLHPSSSPAVLTLSCHWNRLLGRESETDSAQISLTLIQVTRKSWHLPPYHPLQSQSEKLIVLGDLNARVGRDHHAWDRVIGRHRVGNVTVAVFFCSTPEPHMTFPSPTPCFAYRLLTIRLGCTLDLSIDILLTTSLSRQETDGIWGWQRRCATLTAGLITTSSSPNSTSIFSRREGPKGRRSPIEWMSQNWKTLRL